MNVPTSRGYYDYVGIIISTRMRYLIHGICPIAAFCPVVEILSPQCSVSTFTFGAINILTPKDLLSTRVNYMILEHIA